MHNSFAHNVTTPCLAHTESDEQYVAHIWGITIALIKQPLCWHQSLLTSTDLYCKKWSTSRTCRILSSLVSFSARNNDKCVIACSTHEEDPLICLVCVQISLIYFSTLFLSYCLMLNQRLYLKRKSYWRMRCLLVEFANDISVFILNQQCSLIYWSQSINLKNKQA